MNLYFSGSRFMSVSSARRHVRTIVHSHACMSWSADILLVIF